MRFRIQSSDLKQYMFGVPDADPEASIGLANPNATVTDLIHEITTRLPIFSPYSSTLTLAINGFELIGDQPFRQVISQDELLTYSFSRFFDLFERG